MDKKVDVLGLGYTAVDELLYLDSYPAADTKSPVRRRERHCGGLAATALVAAARLGCRCATREFSATTTSRGSSSSDSPKRAWT